MASSRRIGSENSAIRAAIVEAAAAILQEEGMAELTSRRVAQKAGVKAQLVHYYFRTMDDLVVAVGRRIGGSGFDHLSKALTADAPLRALWDTVSDTRAGVVEMEFITRAFHNERLRDEVVRYGEQARTMQTHAIARHFELQGTKPPVPPIAIAFLINAVRRMLATESALGNTQGHREVIAVIEDWLKRVTKRRTRKQPSKKRNKGKS